MEAKQVNQIATIKANIDPKIVTSVVAGLGLFGLITWAAVRSGIKPLQVAAKAANGGK